MPLIGRTQKNRSTHRMREREDRRWAVRQHDFVNEGCQVDAVIVETAHIAAQRIAQHPLRESLAPPIDHSDRESASAQVTHGLEIFLDKLGASREQAYSSPAPGRRRPARKP